MKQRSVLVLNCGSTSIKFALYSWQTEAAPRPIVTGALDISVSPPVLCMSNPTSAAAIALTRAIKDLDRDTKRIALALIETFRNQHPEHELCAVAHRVVHGGASRCDAEIVTDALIDDLARLTPLAPLHQPANLAPIVAVRVAYPALVQVACFDTAFHCHQPECMQLTALPRRYFELGLRRMGFHGLSYEFVVGRIAQLHGDVPKRLVAAHLGGGASVCGMLNGLSVSCSMGTTALDGLPMGTRSGSIDPGLLLYLMESQPMSIAQTRTMLYEHSGLLGISGISGDMRVLMGNSSPAAKEAINVFVSRTAREIAATATDLGGIDILVFTGGIGVHQPIIRQRICEKLAWMGVSIACVDASATTEVNEPGDHCINDPRGRVQVWAIRTDEELVMANAAISLIAKANL
jgi:acetate kinase